MRDTTTPNHNLAYTDKMQPIKARQQPHKTTMHILSHSHAAPYPTLIPTNYHKHVTKNTPIHTCEITHQTAKCIHVRQIFSHNNFDVLRSKHETSPTIPDSRYARSMLIGDADCTEPLGALEGEGAGNGVEGSQLSEAKALRDDDREGDGDTRQVQMGSINQHIRTTRHPRPTQLENQRK